MRKPSEFANFPTTLAALASYGPYRAVIAHVVDGDTFYVMCDVGLNDYAFRVLRLKDVDTPEMNTPEGKAARYYVLALMPPGTPCVVTTYRDTTTFGRYVADVQFLHDGLSFDLAAFLVNAGHAVRVR